MINKDISFVPTRQEALQKLYSKVKGGEATAEEKELFDQYFGPDTHCPDWKCYRHNLPVAYDLYPLKSAPGPGEFSEKRLPMLKAYVHYSLHMSLFLDMTFKFHNLAEVLFWPDDDRISAYESAALAAFRASFVWPLFGSTQVFWEAFEKAYREIEWKIYEWPVGEPNVNICELKKEFEEAGDEMTVKFIEILISLDGEKVNFGTGCSNSISGLCTMQPGY